MVDDMCHVLTEILTDKKHNKNRLLFVNTLTNFSNRGEVEDPRLLMILCEHLSKQKSYFKNTNMQI